jgi:N-acetylglucosaminyldiphosphoundecaprenol N-acetyl-beta-D-mannosaminyltransferase
MEAIQRVDILGCPFDVISLDETVAVIKHTVLTGGRLQIATGNIDYVMQARRNPLLAAQLRRAGLVTADGVPIVWAASLLGTPLRGRVSGTDLVWRFAEVSAELGCAVALLGSAPGVAARAAQKMRERYPRALLHAIPTPFTLGAPENAELLRQIKAVNARIVLVSLGTPRQESWIEAHFAECGANVIYGSGSAFDIISGDQPRAPRLLRDHGFEWLHRLLREPRRLGRRYLIDDSPFLFHLLAALARRTLWGAESKS